MGIPALPPDVLRQAIELLHQSNLSERKKRALQAVILEASKPDRQAVRRWKGAEKKRMMTTRDRLIARTAAIIERGRGDLMSLSDDEWNRLVDNANQENQL